VQVLDRAIVPEEGVPGSYAVRPNLTRERVSNYVTMLVQENAMLKDREGSRSRIARAARRKACSTGPRPEGNPPTCRSFRRSSPAR